jgi:acyl-coenzyme A synthetase/AMP-(fatty) acid ligase
VSLRCSPQQLQALVATVQGQSVRFPTLQKVEVGGASIPAELLWEARATLCTNIVGVYGSTEVGLVAHAPTALLQAHSQAAGYVAPGVEVRIADESGQPLPPGVEGAVQVRSPTMAAQYVGDAATTAACFRDGWFVPGDLGLLRPDGALIIRGRIDEMINAGGVKLSPTLVDDFLLAQPGVRDAAAFAHRRPGQSDQVWAAVVCDPGFDESVLMAAARAKLNSRAPVRLLRVQEIPRNAMGKPLRKQLAEEHASL